MNEKNKKESSTANSTRVRNFRRRKADGRALVKYEIDKGGEEDLDTHVEKHGGTKLPV